MFKQKNFWLGVLGGAALLYVAVVAFRGGWNWNPLAAPAPQA